MREYKTINITILVVSSLILTRCTSSYKDIKSSDIISYSTTKAGILGNQEETIKGETCDYYSDRESRNSAHVEYLSRHKRKQRRSYLVHILSIIEVKNYVLTNDLIKVTVNAHIKDVKIIKKDEYPEKNHICIGIEATVRPADIANQVGWVIRSGRYSENLPKEDSQKGDSSKYIYSISDYAEVDSERVIVRALCKKTTRIAFTGESLRDAINNPFLLPLAILTLGLNSFQVKWIFIKTLWFDSSNQPFYSVYDGHFQNCDYKHQVLQYSIRSPKPESPATLDYGIYS